MGDVTKQSWIDYGSIDFLAAGIAQRFGRYAAGSNPDTGEGGRTLAEISAASLDLRGLPPLHIDYGQCECLHDQIAEFADKARAAGVEVSEYEAVDMVHVFAIFTFTLMDEPLNVFKRINDFVRRVVPDDQDDLEAHDNRDAPIKIDSLTAATTMPREAAVLPPSAFTIDANDRQGDIISDVATSDVPAVPDGMPFHPGEQGDGGAAEAAV
jgi:hypothetical protein